MGRPILSYRLGLTDNPRVGSQGQSQASDGVNLSDSYTAGSRLRLLTTDIGMNYSKSIARNRTATDASKNTSTRFPDFSFSLNRLGDLKLIKNFFTNFAYTFGYYKQVDERGSERTGETYGRNTGEHFSPLASLTMNWKKGIQTTLRFTRDITTTRDLKETGSNRSITKDYDNSVMISNTYSFSAPQGVKLPFLRKIKFRSNLSLSASITLTSNLGKSSVGGNPFNVTKNNGQFSLVTTAGYSFSSQVTGGFNARWVDTNDKKTKRKTHLRELGIYMQISF